jgi:CelD/BcsL family acetyltransferase involved in cellulose biosynthesis
VAVAFVTSPELIEDEWWTLWAADADATPFQSPAWLIPWREQFGADEAGVLRVEQDGRTVALLPIYRHQGRWLLWGAGTSDWLGGVFAPDVDLGALADAVYQLDAPLEIFQIAPNSPLLAIAASGRLRQSEYCVELPLPAALPRHMLDNLHYYRRRADREGLGEAALAGPEAFKDLVALHTRRWQQRQQPGVLADPRVIAWHEGALPRLEAAGLLRFYCLRRGDDIVGALYGLRGKQRAYYYISGFEPGLRAAGLGTLLIGHAIAEAEREGAQSFDFLRGQEPYKYHWGGRDQPSYATTIEPVERRYA